MKRLFEFSVNKEQVVEDTQIVKGENGEDIKVTRPVTKFISKSFFLRKPTRELYDEAELYYNVRLAEGIKAGLLTNALLAKRFANDGGVLSEDEKEAFAVSYLELFDAQNDYQKLATVAEAELTPEEKEKLEAVKKKITGLRQRIQEFELVQTSLYDHTAENRARNKTIFWWMMMLAYRINDKDEEEPYFGNGDLDSRLKVYDDLEDATEPFFGDVNKRFLYFTSFWYVGRAKNQAEFEQLAAQLTAKAETP